jgi:asparagine synthase (glutamine-hydrolysing)
MCGLAGFWGGSYNHNQASDALNEMGFAIAHRGPDDSGIFFDQYCGLGIVHRRLSILDLSSSGSQPMTSNDNRYVIAFNGEIYNHLEIRKDINTESTKPVHWNGHSDTETILAAIVLWGIRATLSRLVGMFAIALWDKESKTLTLARDRIGEKPLYYGFQNGCLMFGSELKALKKHPFFDGDIDRKSLALYFRSGFIPAPNSIYRNIFKLPQSSLIEIKFSDLESKTLNNPELYWSLENTVIQGNNDPLIDSFEDNIGALESALMRAVDQQQISDVPLGAFLSGGIDSSLITALMQSQSAVAVSTFTIGFEDSDFNEANQAKLVAAKLGTSHNELYMPPEEGLKVIPELPYLYDEPFADPSQLPTILLSKMTKRHVTVALSGDGGDELFGGYNRYILVQRIWKKISKFPLPIRKVLSNMFSTPSIKSLDFLLRRLLPLLPGDYAFNQPIEKLNKFISIIDAVSPEQIYTSLISHQAQPSSMVLNVEPVKQNLEWGERIKATVSFDEWMMAMDMQTYLPDDVLVKVDRASMGSSLEVRAPFLDHKVVEIAWKIPLEEKVQGDLGKIPLRKILYKYIPEKYFMGSKKGFGVPIADWLRGPLLDWAENLLDEDLLVKQGYLNTSVVRKMWREHLKYKRNWQYQLWDVLMFQSWLEYNENA